MVSSVNNSLGSAAYTKSAQSVPTQPNKRQEAVSPTELQSSHSVREPEKSERQEKANDNVTRRKDTQLEARNTEETLDTEQARGSLLDLAV